MLDYIKGVHELDFANLSRNKKIHMNVVNDCSDYSHAETVTPSRYPSDHVLSSRHNLLPMMDGSGRQRESGTNQTPSLQ